MPFITDTQTGSTGRETTAEEALRRGSKFYARDIVDGMRSAANTAGLANTQSAVSASSMGVNPFIAQRNAARVGVQQAGQMRGEMMRAIAQRTRDLEAQRNQEREAEQNRGRQMIGSLLQTGGAVASMIPGIGSAIGGAAGAVGGMVSGQPQQGGGGIGGAVQGLMGAVSGQPQQAPMQRVPQAAAPVQGGDQFGIWHGPAAEVGGAFRPQLGAPQNVGAGAVAQAQAPGVALTEEQRRRMSAPSSFGSLAQGGAWWRNGR